MIFYGNYYNNYQYGTNYADSMYGYGGNDTQYGYGGNDYLSGGSGYDYLNGGLGSDTLVGGTSADSLVGGYDTSTDYFRFAQGDSNSYSGGADTIYDWNVAYDYIDSTIAGTSSNYGEMFTTANNIGTARSVVENSSLRYEDHAFVYNSATDTGYLLSDLDRNFTFETGVVIRGAGSAADMNWSDIV